MVNKFRDIVKQMRVISEHLLPYTYPSKPFEYEQDVNCLKQRQVCVDGTQVMLCFSLADYSKQGYILESLQIQSIYTPFLPFNLVCKLGRSFLGDKNLSYVEFMRAKKKVYCWTIKTNNGEVMPPGEKTVPGSYEGFEYSILNPGAVDLL
ncbi:MAG TPA: hypothetical protein VMW36_08515 [Patescibacteria group bacterium]|nr:hypothetical protein [Patescibacteria group bacterium]